MSDAAAFAETLARAAKERREPAGLSPALRVLWLDATGAWEDAHDLAQEIDDPVGAHLHAYLHRVEGDLPNAHYWYRRAGAAPANGPFEDEWRALVVAHAGQ